MFGFHSLSDFGISLFGLKYAKFNILIIGLATLTSFITNYVWDSPQAIYTLWTIMFIDWITGIIKAVSKNQFSSTKLPRMIVFFVCTSILIALSWWVAKFSIFFYPLPSLVYSGFVAVYFVSLIENFAELGWLPIEMVTIIRKRFGFKALIKKYDNENGTPE